jgi:GTP-binding protein
VRADPQTGSLSPLKSKRIFEAERGGIGIGNNRYGRKGKDYVVNVPCGCTLYNKRDELLIRDLVSPGEEVVVLTGGRGGYGNHRKRPVTQGEASRELELLISFKIIADIFLVGLPNSGKTTLLKRLTGARVAESEYPFATKSPHLGTYRDHSAELRVCELPAIYRASDEGRGLGTHFLKHLERARLIFLMLDFKSEFAEDLKSGHEILIETVRKFNPAFLDIPRFIVVNKADVILQRSAKENCLQDCHSEAKPPPNRTADPPRILAEKNLKSEMLRFAQHDKFQEKLFFISAKTGKGVDSLMKAARKERESKNAARTS